MITIAHSQADFAKSSVEDKLQLANTDWQTYLTLSAREDESSFVKNLKEVMHCGDDDAHKIIRQAQNGDYKGFDPELLRIAEKAAMLMAKHEAGVKLFEHFAGDAEQGSHGNANGLPSNLAGMPHKEQVAHLSEFFAHGGSFYDAAKAAGASEAEARKIDKVAKDAGSKFDEEHKDEQARINGIDDEKERKREQDKFNRDKAQSVADQVRQVNTSVANTLAEATVQAHAKSSVALGGSSSRYAIGGVSQADQAYDAKRLTDMKRRIDSGMASEKEKAVWLTATLAAIPKERQTAYLKEHPEFADIVAKNAIKSDDAMAQRISLAVAVSEDKKNDSGKAERWDDKKATAVAAKKIDAANDNEDSLFVAKAEPAPINKSFLASKRNEGAEAPHAQKAPTANC